MFFETKYKPVLARIVHANLEGAFKQTKILRCSTKKLNHIVMTMLKRFFALAPCLFACLNAS